MLRCTNFELRSVQLAAREEKKRSEENLKQLNQLLQVAFQERDQAKDHLKRLFNAIMQSGLSPVCHVLPNSKLESPQFILPTVGNSCLAESDSLSETYNHRSYVSSSVDSLFDSVSPSPDFSNMNLTDSINMDILQQPFVQEYSSSSSIGLSSELGQLDPASALIDRLAMKKPLPEKGKLLKAVIDAGSLLQPLLLAGPLPQWRNPPPPQPLHIPPISIKGLDLAALVHKPTVDPNYHIQNPLVASCYENSQKCSTSVLNFPSTGGSCMKNKLVPSSGSGTVLSHRPSLLLNMKHRKVQ